MNQVKLQQQLAADNERNQIKMQAEIQKLKLKEIETALAARQAAMQHQMTLSQSQDNHRMGMMQQGEKMMMDRQKFRDQQVTKAQQAKKGNTK